MEHRFAGEHNWTAAHMKVHTLGQPGKGMQGRMNGRKLTRGTRRSRLAVSTAMSILSILRVGSVWLGVGRLGLVGLRVSSGRRAVIPILLLVGGIVPRLVRVRFRYARRTSSIDGEFVRS